MTLFWNFSAPFPLGVNFINIIQAAFARADPKSAKKTDNLTVFFAISGSTHAKAARRMLIKLTPGLIDSKFPSYLILIKCIHRGKPVLGLSGDL